jgi:hypothetical protein
LRIRRWAAFLGLAALLSQNLSADDAPWGFNSPPPVASDQNEAPTLVVETIDFLVSQYRSNKVDTSIHRCLFDVSCSHLAEVALKKRGILVGTLVFVDRYFYRENNQARELYPMVANKEGLYHFSDQFFVP